MKAILGVLTLAAATLHADMQTVTASNIFVDQYGDWGGAYATAAQLAPFDSSLGALQSVDLRLSAVYQESFHYGQNAFTGTPYNATITTTETGVSSFLGTQSATQNLQVYINSEACLAPGCTVIASLQFGGEDVLTGQDLTQFESAALIFVSANTSVDFSTSPGVWCCVPEAMPGNDWFPKLMYGSLTLDVSATYSYASDPPPTLAPEPRTWPWLLFALPIMVASGWRKRKCATPLRTRSRRSRQSKKFSRSVTWPG